MNKKYIQPIFLISTGMVLWLAIYLVFSYGCKPDDWVCGIGSSFLLMGITPISAFLILAGFIGLYKLKPYTPSRALLWGLVGLITVLMLLSPFWYFILPPSKAEIQIQQNTEQYLKIMHDQLDAQEDYIAEQEQLKQTLFLNLKNSLEGKHTVIKINENKSIVLDNGMTYRLDWWSQQLDNKYPTLVADQDRFISDPILAKSFSFSFFDYETFKIILDSFVLNDYPLDEEKVKNYNNMIFPILPPVEYRSSKYIN